MQNLGKNEMRKNKNDILDQAQISIKVLREMVDIQCRDGNWNYDRYMHGMANGMIFALSLFDNKEPEYLEAPEEWLEDKKELEDEKAKWVAK